MVFILTFIYEIWLFAYFVISNIVKFLGFRQYTTVVNQKASYRAYGVTGISLLFSAFIGLSSSFFLSHFFSYQLTLLQNAQQKMFENSGLTGFVAIPVFAFWGIFYYILLMFFDWFADYSNFKTGIPFVRTYK